MSLDFIAGPISSMVSAAISPNKLAGIIFSPAGRLRTTFPMLEFDGKFLNVFWI